MLNSTDIHNIKFGKVMGRYNAEEVEIFLDKVEADYIQHERIVKEFQAKIESLNTEIEELKASQSSIQNVLLKAQILADKIVNEAKDKSEEIIRNAESNISIITAREKELSDGFELKAKERKSALEKEMEQIVSDAKKKADSITAAAEDSVARQQILFEKLKMEIAAFKAGITAKYKEHLDILNTIPDTVPSDPKQIAEIVSSTIDKLPDPMQFIIPKEDITNSDTVEEVLSSKTGFVVENIEDTSEEE